MTVRWRVPIAQACLALAVTAVGLHAATEGFDPASLSLPANLASNCSFEGDEPKNGVPDGWHFYANPRYESLSETKALHGKRAVLVDRPVLEGIVHVAAEQWLKIQPGHAYTLSAWVFMERCNGGSVRIYLDYYSAARHRIIAHWAECKQKTSDWRRLTVTLDAPKNAVYARLLVPYVDGDTRVFTDCVTLTSPTGGLVEARGAVGDLCATRTTCSSVYLAWTSPAARHEVDFRRVGAPKWQTIRNVCSQFHNVIMLSPKTQYEFRARAILPARLDQDGKRIAGGPAENSPVVRAQTTAVAPKAWQGLKLSPTWHVNTFPANTYYPCIEFYDGFFYVVECWGGGLHLSKIRPKDFGAEWTKQIVPKVQKVSTYQGIPDTCIFGNKLYVMWNRQATGNPKYVIMDSRQLFVTYDLKTGKLSAETAIASTKPGCGTWEGGLDVYQGKVWMMWLEVWLKEKNRRRTRLVMRPYVDGKFTGTHVFDNCPSAYPYGPSMSTFDGKLILLWSDLEATEKNTEHEPIYFTFFDGQRFSESVKFNDKVRSRYAKGAQLGDSFYCIYKCNSQYPNTGYMYHDLALTRIGPGGRDIETIYWVDDVKYNSSPDMCRMGDALYAVYGKIEHLYGRRDDPAIDHGSFWGKITR